MRLSGTELGESRNKWPTNQLNGIFTTIEPAVDAESSCNAHIGDVVLDLMDLGPRWKLYIKCHCNPLCGSWDFVISQRVLVYLYTG